MQNKKTGTLIFELANQKSFTLPPNKKKVSVNNK